MQIVTRNELLESICSDLKKYKFIYLQAPCGWGKTTLLKQLCERYKRGNCVLVEDTAVYKKTGEDEEGASLFLIDNLGDWVISGRMEKLVDYISAQTPESRFVLSGRIPVPPQLLPYKLTSQIKIYDSRTLGFSLKELIEVAKGEGDLLREDQIIRLREYSRGMPLFVAAWIVLLLQDESFNNRMLGLSMEESFRYFEAMCFRSYPYEYQTLLLKMAFFPKINTELLMQVFDYREREAHRILEELRANYGAICPVAEDEYILEEFLKAFLQKRQSAYLGVGEMKWFYRKAYDYFAERREWKEAVCYAYLEGNISRMITALCEACIHFQMWEEYRWLDPYMRNIPESIIQAEAVLPATYAMLEALYGSKARAEHYVDILRKRLAETESTGGEYKKLKKIYAYIELILPYQKVENLGEQLKLAQKTEETDGPEVRISPGGGLPSLLHGGRDFCGYIPYVHEFWKQNEDYVAAIMKEGHEGCMEGIMGEVCYEQGRTEEALNFLTKSLSLASRQNNTEICFIANLQIAKIMYVRNQAEQAQGALKGLDRIFPNGKASYIQKNLDAFCVYAAMLKGDCAATDIWIEDKAPDEYDFFFVPDSYTMLMKIYVYIQRENLESALLIIRKLMVLSEDYGWTYYSLHLRILEAAVYYRAADDKWQEKLEACLTDAEPYHFIRIFADRGALLFPMLKALADSAAGTDKDSAYFKAVLNDTKRMALLYPNFLSPHKKYEELSRYEKDVLMALCQGKRNSEIAKQLFLSENTIKYHLKKIYGKLGVSSRSEAIARARELKIV